jgi:hypothetical protein
MVELKIVGTVPGGRRRQSQRPMPYAADVKLPDCSGKNPPQPISARSHPPHDAGARRAPVSAVATVRDPGSIQGKMIRDMPVLCWDGKRYVGDRVAAVAADTPEAAEEALNPSTSSTNSPSGLRPAGGDD